MSFLEIRDVSKSFGIVEAVRDFSLEVGKGEIVTLLGPSGCGKTTALRIIAGLLKPDKGEVVVSGKTLTSAEKGIFVHPSKRKMGMVFQNYAVWPHMNVFNNIAYPLRVQKLPKNEIRKKVSEIITLVKLEGLERRDPTQLSGGQQQRVALARALIAEPEILLLDEPLSNLDAKLREEMRFEIRELQRKLQITTIYVTHDQAEAMVLSDRIAIMNEGRILQVGTPREIYEKPNTTFVASFVGVANMMKARVNVRLGERRGIALTDGGYSVECTLQPEMKEGDHVFLLARPEDIEIYFEKPPTANIIKATLLRTVYLGDSYDCVFEAEGQKIRVKAPPFLDVPSQAREAYLHLDPKRTTAIYPDKQ